MLCENLYAVRVSASFGSLIRVGWLPGRPSVLNRFDRVITASPGFIKL